MIKKGSVILLIAIFAISPMFGQKKKNIQIHKIKSITVYNEDFENKNGKQVKESYERFDESGNTLEEIEYDKKGVEKQHVLYEYDEDGNKTKETYLNPNGSKEKIIAYKYQDDLKIERIIYLSDGTIKSKKKYIYDFQK